MAWGPLKPDKFPEPSSVYHCNGEEAGHKSMEARNTKHPTLNILNLFPLTPMCTT